MFEKCSFNGHTPLAKFWIIGLIISSATIRTLPYLFSINIISLKHNLERPNLTTIVTIASIYNSKVSANRIEIIARGSVYGIA